MPSPYSDFFLNAASNIIQFETVEIAHPNFSTVYRIVRNNVAGLTATLEDSSTGVFTYYPLKITPSGSYNDMDQTLQVSFGDLGQILPQELDRLIADTQQTVFEGALLGAWCDGSGNLLLPPFLIGNGGQFYVPRQATTLQLGVCDSFFFDNGGNFSVTINGGAPFNVSGLTRLYDYVAGVKNDAYPYSPTSSTGPVVKAVTPGTLLQLTASGIVAISGTDNVGPLGDVLLPAGVPGTYVPRPSLPKTYTKPTLLYRTFRSDDLSGVLYGPIAFEIVSVAFKLEGATLQCNAPRLNLVSTGERYALDRFPMLHGFI